MKNYKWPEIGKIAKEQGYKLAALENLNGEKITSFNQIKTPIDKHLRTLETRLKSDIHPDGVYNVLLAHSISKSRTPDRYPVVKGNLTHDQLSEIEKKSMPLTPVIVQPEAERVLTWDSALQMQQTISTQAARIQQLEFENAQLADQLDDAIAELSNLQETQKPNDTVSFLKETLPSLLPAIDRYFDLEEKKLSIAQGQPTKTQTRQTQGRKPAVFTPGSPNHLVFIEYLYRQNKEDKLNYELDRLEEANPDLYNTVCEKLGIELSDEGGE